MSFTIARFLAWRYITGVQDNTRVNTVSKVCFLSIFIGTLCLALQIFVSDGFDRALTSKMQSIYPQLIIEAPTDQSFDYSALQKKLHSSFFKEILHTAPVHTKRIIIRPIDAHTPSAVILKAIDPEQESLVSSLEQKLIDQEQLKKVLHNNGIIIGKKLADFYDLKVGDKCTVLFTPDDQFTTQSNSFEETIVTVGGIMETGIVQYDKHTVICSLATMQNNLQEQDVTQIGLKLKPGIDDEIFSQKLREHLGIEAHSWKTLYPALVAATKLEKYVLFLLLLLMTFIASANIIALLFMQISRKRTDIALLKTLGMTDNHIVMLFTFMGTIIVSTAAFTGTLCAVLVGLLFKTYPFIELPDAYFCTHLPVHIEWSTALMVFGVVLILGTLSSWFSARSAQAINITETLRFEG